MSRLDDIAIERRILKRDCLSVHPTAAVYHAGQHEVEYLVIGKQQVKDMMIILIKSESDVFNGSDHQEDITEYANQLIAKVEAL